MKDGFMYYYKYHNGGQETKGCISLYKCRIETSSEIPKDQLGFQLITKTRYYHMYADSDTETQDWIDAIKRQKARIERQVDSIEVV